MRLENLEKAGTEAVKDLRRQKLSTGNFFMINTPELPDGQCYIEYPDGSIILATLSSEQKDFKTIKALSVAESNFLRTRYQLY